MFTDLSHSETRLSVFLDGFEVHLYNRSQTYAQLEKLFGLVPNIIPEQPEAETEAQARYSTTLLFCFESHEGFEKVNIDEAKSSVCVCISVCLFVANHISVTSEAIAIKFDTVTDCLSHENASCIIFVLP